MTDEEPQTPTKSASDKSPVQSARKSAVGARSKAGRRKKKPRSGDLFLLLVLFGLLLVFYKFEPNEIFGFFYNKWFGLILIIMIAEYLVLKSADRTRVFRLENRGLRERRRRDQELLNQAKRLLENIPAEEEKRETWKEKAKSLSEAIKRHT